MLRYAARAVARASALRLDIDWYVDVVRLLDFANCCCEQGFH
eukprot:COSAG02_NODE_14999_length_1216_cov_1.236347_2_plen_41_part_01